MSDCVVVAGDSNAVSGGGGDEDVDNLSLCSTLSGVTMGGIDERPTSAMSLSSTKGSRIPRLSRSNSLRDRPQRNSLGNAMMRSTGYGESRSPLQEASYSSPMPNMIRSQSFASSRGLTGFMPDHFIGSSKMAVPFTPELARRKFSTYVSPYSRKAIDNERKNQSFIAGMISRERSFLASSRRQSMPSLISQKDSDDFVISDESCESNSVAVHNCCGKWQGPEVTLKKSNIVHCSHNHEMNDDYLTPTQRAAVKIRELQGQLSKARKQIAERDYQISILTKDLVEKRLRKSRINDAEYSRVNLPKLSRLSLAENIPTLSTRSFSPTGEASCVTPNSDDCEFDVKHQKDLVPPSPTDNSDFGDPSRSLADSGHYEDLPSPCMSSRDSLDVGRSRKQQQQQVRHSTDSPDHDPDDAILWAAVGAAEEGVRAEFNRRVEILKENHMDEYQELKERHNDRVELLLSKLSDANLRYFELRPQYDKAQEQIRELERTISSGKTDLDQNQQRQQKIYLQMYLKGQQAAKFDVEEKSKDQKTSSPHSSDPDVDNLISEKLKNRDPLLDNNVVLTLMRQLAQSEELIQKLKTSQSEASAEEGRRRSNSSYSILRREQIDPEITLQFLKSAIYYFLTDKENAQGHLRAIESILGYSTMERGNINRFTKL